MNRKEALNILEATIDEKEVIVEAFDLQIFNSIQIFLKDPVVPNLIESRKKKIKLLGEAFYFLSESENQESTHLDLGDLNDAQLWEDFFHTYENNKAKLRQSISNSKGVESVLFLLDELNSNEMAYARRLTEGLKAIPQLDVKMSEAVALLGVKIELNKLLQQGIIDNSFDSLMNIPANLDIFNLSKEVNRLRKLIE